MTTTSVLVLFVAMAAVKPGTPAIGRECVTTDKGFVAESLTDIQLMTRIVAANDTEAAQKLVQSGRVTEMKAGVKVIVEDRVDEIFVAVRPRGQVEAVWTSRAALDCTVR